MDTELLTIAVTAIIPNPHQPRTEFEPVALQELADSIQEHGVIQPLIVEPAPEGQGYLLVAGERRLRAAQLAGLVEVPCVVRPAAATAQARLELALIENVQRADLSAADEARAYQQLHDEFGLSDGQIGQRVGKARSTISNLRRLNDLPAPVLERIGDGEKDLPLRYARSLVPLARLDPQAAQDIAVSVAVADESERQGEFDDRLADVLRQKSHNLSAALFTRTWKPKATLDLDGGPQPVPACQGCEFALRADFADWCARPACFTAKQALFAELEAKRVAKALGVPLAAPDETVHPLPVDPQRFYQSVETAKELLALQHASLRLVVDSKSASRQWENAEVTGSKAIRLVTTDPAALRAAAGWKEQPPAPSSSAVSAREDWEAKRQAHTAAVERITAAAALAAPAFDKVWPAHLPLLRWLVDQLNNVEFAPADVLETDQKSNAAACRRYLSHVLFASAVDLAYGESNALKIVAPVEALARTYKVKLPKGWAEPLKKPTKAAAQAAEKIAKTAKKK